MRIQGRVSNGFDQHLDQWVINGVTSGVRDFESLLRFTHGAYPALVLESLNRLVEQRIISASRRDSLRSSRSLSSSHQRSVAGPNLPVPHPLDFAWRFSNEAIDQLLQLAAREARNVVCLGTPSVYTAGVQSAKGCKFALVDADVETIRQLASHDPSADLSCADVLVDPIPKCEADTIIADPPWYYEHILAFLWASAQMCKVGGQILISLPALGTRPSVRAELLAALSFAQRLGLSVEHVIEECLLYETPQFEINALRAIECPIPGNAWRRGSLYILRYSENSGIERPRFTVDSRWLEAEVWGTRIRFRMRGEKLGGDPTLISIVRNDILDSVSRRHELRSTIDVWTSGNRVFRCAAPQILHRIATVVARDRSAGGCNFRMLTQSFDRVPLDAIERAASQVRLVAALERSERRVIGNG